ncbi:ABC transporter permease [Microtetraspora niveoalba]|uniref:ABC transporter permease n=1 Tax=Microtetraspora niveoalba TaxID=46175 RepID=UPI000833CE13|nr:ABC transporter permease [Microtetraspora niveoalba]
MGENELRGGVGLRLWGALVGAVLIAPTLIVIPLSFTGKASFTFPPESWSLRWYQNFFTDPGWRDALLTSVRIALLVAVLASALGTAAALALDSGRVPGKGLINGLLLSPMVVPQIVAAIGVYAVFLKWGLAGTTLGFVLAHTALAIPFVIVAVSAVLRGYDRRLEQAAASLGAGPLTTFFQVTLPLILPGVLSGAVFAFVTSLDEVVIALYLQSPELHTLPVQMFSSVTVETDPTIAAASTLVLVVTTMLILLPQLLRRRSPEETR